MYNIYYYNRNFRLTIFSAFSFYKLTSLHKNDNILPVPNTCAWRRNPRAHMLYVRYFYKIFKKLEGLYTILYKKPLAAIIYTFYE